MKRFNGALLGGAALLLLAPVSVRAAAFVIDDTLPTEQIRFSANDFEGGISINGSLLQTGLNNEQSRTVPEADTTGNPIVYNFDGRWLTQGQPLPPPVQVAFIEPGGQNLLSDVLFVDSAADGDLSRITGRFVSDASELGLNPAQYLSPGIPVTNWPETNGAFLFSAPFLTGSARSDVEIPEPASILVLGVLGSVLVSLRKRR